jgi:AraC-like DNA-binding protein
LFYAQELGHFRALPSYFTERERLDSYLIVYTLSGRGRLTYQKSTHTLGPGQAFFIHCMEYQHYASDSDDLWNMLWIHLNGQSVRAYYNQYVSQGGPVRTLPEDSRFADTLSELIQLHRSRSLRGELASSKLIVGLLTDLVLLDSIMEIDNAPVPSYISEMLRLIDKRYAEKLSLDRLAREFAVNKYHLAKEFKRHTGFPPGEYIINARITRAQELLKYSDLPVSEIAEQVGIEHVSHFINLFRQRTGQTPLAFRRTWQRPLTNRGQVDEKESDC